MTAIIPLPVCGGIRLLGDDVGDPNPGGCEAVVGQDVASQGLLHIGEQEDVCPHQIKWTAQVFWPLDDVGGEPIAD